MVAWLPAVKLILPHVANIVGVAVPMFTRARAGKDGEVPNAELQRQIDELQAAATQNATHVRELAQQLEETIRALDASAAEVQQRLRRAHALALAGFGTALVSAVLALIALLSR